jgi:hypothetical protein
VNEAKSDPATVQGVASVVRKKPADVVAQPAVLRMTVEVIRAGTGKKETFELVGTPVLEE